MKQRSSRYRDSSRSKGHRRSLTLAEVADELFDAASGGIAAIRCRSLSELARPYSFLTWEGPTENLACKSSCNLKVYLRASFLYWWQCIIMFFFNF